MRDKSQVSNGAALHSPSTDIAKNLLKAKPLLDIGYCGGDSTQPG